MFRSKAKWVEFGEKNTKFFLNLEKQNYNARYIRKLITQTGTEVTKPEDILEEEKRFYKGLYSTNITDEGISTEFFSSKNIPKLNSLDKQLCDSPIKLDEIAAAIKTLKNDKSPGNDGFTTNFYKFFWPDIKLFLYDSFRYSFETKMLSDNQRRGILNLIPKPNKDLRYLKNWRPISILNTDYKILAKILADRLQSVLPMLISNDQVGYIKDRNITENVRIIEDIMSFTTLKKIPGLILLVDFEKAFDSVEWSFLFKTLQNFNFGKNFIQWVKILYTNILSCVGNNGYYSNYFELSRGIRQGCPLSALLFILVAEVMAIEIRNNEKVQGIVVGKNIFKICQLADDTTLFLDNLNSIIQAVKIFQEFTKCSGLKMNLEKSEVIPIGTLKLKEVILPKCVSKLVVNKSAFKTLGIYFSPDINESVNLNFEPKISAMKTIINIWSARKLSLKGKVLIIKTLLLQQVNYLLSTMYTPKNVLLEIDKLLFQFLWSKKPAKVKKNCIISNYKNGGIKMPDVFSVHIASKVKWIKKLLNIKTSKKWNYIFLELFNIERENLNKKLPDDYRKKCLTNFHKQVFDCWNSLHGKEPMTTGQILNEFIFNNKFIVSDEKPLQLHQFKLMDKKFNDLVIKEIINDNGEFFSLSQLNDAHSTKLDVLSYNRILSAIPSKWKKILKQDKNYKCKITKNPGIFLKGRFTQVTKVNNKALYWIVTGKKIQEPTSVEKWIENYPFLESAPWKKIFRMLHLISNESYLHSFQYKVVHIVTAVAEFSAVNRGR